jgi:four helix bundle suffix protein
MFGGTIGHLKLDSWILANIIYLATQHFCSRFLNRTNDPCGRLSDQMTQAARSGCANIAEGSARGATSRETEMKLTDVARASLAELHGDCLNWLMRNGHAPWRKDSPESQTVFALRLDTPAYGSDVAHDACVHILAQKRRFDPWLHAEDSITVANALLILIARTLNMLNHQLEAQGKSFKEEGGFREKLTTLRVEARAKQEDAPLCPACEKPMKKRKSAKGDFWGCTGYPDCKGTRPSD